MPNRDTRRPDPSEAARRQAMMVRLVVFAAAIAGVAFGLALVPYVR